jgi:O-antigen/teichoic acid export membrane protein
MTKVPRSLAGQGFIQNAGAALGLQIFSVFVTGVLTLALIRLLGPLDFGRYAITLAIGGIVLMPIDAGLTGSTGRYVAQETKRARMAQMLASGLVLKLVTGLIAAVALIVAAPFIARGYGDHRLVWPIRLLSGIVFGQSLLGFVIGSFSAVRIASRGLVVGALESIAEAAVALGLVLGGAGVVGALVGRAAAFIAAALFGLLLLDRRFRLRRRVSRPTRATIRMVGSYGVTLAFVDAAWALFVQMDVLFIAAFLDSRHAGFFQAPVRVLSLVAYPALAVATAMGPRISIDSSETSLTRFRTSLQLLLAFQILCAVIVLTAGASIVQLVAGANYSDAPLVTRALAPWVLLSGIAPVASKALDYMGAGRERLPFAVLAAAVNAVIDIALIPTIGIVGAAIGTDVGIAVFVGGTLLVCRRHVGYTFRHLFTDVRPFVVPAVVTGVGLTAVDIASNAAVVLAIAVALATILYVAFIVRMPAFRSLVPRLADRS